ncbi:hypothetical protein AB0890_01655 [Streptomyces sp. NPDC005406]|uniref:hypothetical protein n=1 Tax=Streptomyces sp. NPDC005406 TaxID=3155339 RepID=UPI00345303E9
MTISAGTPPTSAPPTGTTPGAVVLGFLTGGVTGTSLAAFVVGCVLENLPLCLTGVGLPAAYGLLLFLAGAPRRAREAAVAPRTALAMIESLHAVGGEATSDVAVRFDLTVAPDDASAHRIEVTQNINLADLPDYRPRGIVVVQYPPDRPWRVRIVKRPTPEWEDRAAGARIDSAPGPARVSEPSKGCAVVLVALLGLLLGAACVILPVRDDLFDQGTTARSPSSVSSTSSTTVVSSGSATVTLGPHQSFLDENDLRRAFDSLTEGKDREERQALTVVVQERVLSVVYAPAGTHASGFDLRSLPYERFPALVRTARTTLGVHSPRTWQITAEGLTGSLTIRTGVSGSDGAASLEADSEGKIVRRTPAR